MSFFKALFNVQRSWFCSLADQLFADIDFFPKLHFCCVSVIESYGNSTGPNPPVFPHCHERLFFFLFLHRNCLHLRHTEKSSCLGWWKALQKRLESPAGLWILWQRTREAIKTAVAASTPMLQLFCMQTQISCATVKLGIAISVCLLFLSQYRRKHRR